MTDLAAIRGVTLDFGNTLVRVDRPTLAEVVRRMASQVVELAGLTDVEGFVTAWSEEQARQFREEVPQLREVDLGQRLARVLARLRGMAPPGDDEPWDDAAAMSRSTPAEVGRGVEAYSRAFVDLVPPLPDATPTIEALHSRGYAVGILSNWPSAVTVDRVADRAGWTPLLAAVVVSQRVGTIKPSPAIFRAAEAAFGLDAPSLLHVGDDWEQDVIGAKAAGWSAAYLRDRQADTPLPTSRPRGGFVPELLIDHLAQLLDGLPARAQSPRAEAARCRPRYP